MERTLYVYLFIFIAFRFENTLCIEPLEKEVAVKKYEVGGIASPPRYSGSGTQSYLKGKDIENLGWIMASFTHDNVDASILPKGVFKTYIAAKDRLFINYLDIFLGNLVAKTGKFKPDSYRMMSTILRRRRSRHRNASMDKSGAVTSTYLLRGNPIAASKDFSRIMDLLGEKKGVKVTNIGPFKVSLSKGSRPNQSVIVFRLDGFDQAKPGCITRKFVYQPRVIRVHLRKSSWLKNIKLKGKTDQAKKRMNQMQRRRQEQANKRKQQRQRQRRINAQRRRQMQAIRRRQLKARAKKRLQNVNRRKQRKYAKAELRKKKQEERKARRLMRQKQRLMRQIEKQKTRDAKKELSKTNLSQ